MKNLLPALLFSVLLLLASPWLMESSSAEQQATPAEVLIDKQAAVASTTLGEKMRNWQLATESAIQGLQDAISDTDCTAPVWAGECPSGQTLDSACANAADFEYTENCELSVEVAQNNLDYLNRRLQELKDEWDNSAQSQFVFDSIVGDLVGLIDSAEFTVGWLAEAMENHQTAHADAMAECCQ